MRPLVFGVVVVMVVVACMASACMGSSDSHINNNNRHAAITPTPSPYTRWIELATQNLHFRVGETHHNHVPATRYSHCAVSDETRGRMIISHGYFYDHQLHRPTWLADTWAFSYTTHSWTRLADMSSPPAPSPRYGHACALWNDKMLLFAGDGEPKDPVSTL